MRLNQRGDVFDIPVIAFMVIGGLMTAVLALYIISEVEATDTYIEEMPATSKQALQDSANTIEMFDYLLVFLFFAGIAVGIISAFLVASHPIFFVLYFMITIIMVALSTVFANIYYEFASSPTLASFANLFPLGNLLMTNLPVIMMAGMFIIAVVMFGKSQSGRGGVRY